MQKNISLVFLSLIATQASAFQAKITPVNTVPSVNTMSPYVTFSGFSAFDQQSLHPGICSTVSINGCGCIFCTQLRMSGR
ncbi:hypothetical protein [Pectobacterium sp. B1J-3]|uniref:hypothetical protein n=1 Tax=Pectobacterium sp. B1J-3 TaxID=3385371 RepID=UPI003905A4B9